MSNPKNRQKIILGLPECFDMTRLLIKNLELLNFEVINISYPDNFKPKKTLSQKLYYFYRKVILQDIGYKNTLRFAPYKEETLQKINKISGKVDYTLLIRADIYPKDFILTLKEKSISLISYHWDGLHRFPAIKNLIPLFDRFFVFDPKDLNKNTLPLTNFYFNSETTNTTITEEYDLYFMGSFIKKRMPQIEVFIKKAKKLDLKTNFLIYCPDEVERSKYPYSEIKYLSEHINYNENIEELKKSKVVIDFLNGTHDGLSFRIFEAIQFDKKLITNNPSIKNYDFYQPNNIFVWDTENFDGIEEFLNSEYIISPKIKEKYSFKNWIHYVLNKPPFIPITLPN